MLPTCRGPSFWGLEEMHLIGHGIAKHMFQLVTDLESARTSKYRPSDEEKSTRSDWPFTFYVSNNDLRSIGKLIPECRPMTPTAFNFSFEDIMNGYVAQRAVDWQDILFTIFPTMIVPCLTNDGAAEPVLALIRACKTALQWRVTEDELLTMEK